MTTVYSKEEFNSAVKVDENRIVVKGAFAEELKKQATRQKRAKKEPSSPHKYRIAVRRDSESVIETSCRNFLRRNRAKRMRCHRRELLREKYERLSEVQECINDIVGAHCGVAERELQYLLEAKEIMSQNIYSARCAENERVDYLLDML